MALAIRLRQQGRKNHTVYRVVVTDARAPRDGAYLESVGVYAPLEADADKALNLKADRIQHWLGQGAQMSESVCSLVKHNAPSVVRQQTEQMLAQKAKLRAKRKARKAAKA
jgi:small subunit ribosomal protein S16